MGKKRRNVEIAENGVDEKSGSSGGGGSRTDASVRKGSSSKRKRYSIDLDDAQSHIQQNERQDAMSEVLAKTSLLAESYQDLDRTRLLDFSSKLLDLVLPVLRKDGQPEAVVDAERSSGSNSCETGHGERTSSLAALDGDFKASGTSLTQMQQARQQYGHRRDLLGEEETRKLLDDRIEALESGLAQLRKAQCEHDQQRHSLVGAETRTPSSGRLENLENKLTQVHRAQDEHKDKQQSEIDALQAETTTLRQEVEMIRLQREQQRQWNKSVLKDQSDNFRKEIDALTTQLKSQEDQQKELRTFRAELAELKASIAAKPTTKQQTSLGPIPTAKKHPFHENDPAGKALTRHRQQQQQQQPPPQPPPRSASEPLWITPQELKDADLIRTSIASRQQSWTHFLSQRGNYLYAPNLENGLKDIVRDIRQFNIRAPRLCDLAFDLAMDATSDLYQFAVKGGDEDQDFHSVPLKIKAFEHIDELAALLLRGGGGAVTAGSVAGAVGLRRENVKRDIAILQDQKKKLQAELRLRIPDFRLDAWFPKTTAGLEKVLKWE